METNASSEEEGVVNYATHMKGREFFCLKWASHTGARLFSGNVRVKSCLSAQLHSHENTFLLFFVVGETKNLMF